MYMCIHLHAYIYISLYKFTEQQDITMQEKLHFYIHNKYEKNNNANLSPKTDIHFVMFI